MKFNVAYILMAVVILALWGLRRLGVEEGTADTVLTFLVIGLGLTPAPGAAGLKLALKPGGKGSA